MTVNVICQCGEFICDKCEYENRHNGEEHMTKEKLGIIEQADYFSETVLAFESKLNEEEKEINKERIEEIIKEKKELVSELLKEEKKKMLEQTKIINDILEQNKKVIINSIDGFNNEFSNKCNEIQNEFVKYKDLAKKIRTICDTSKEKYESMKISQRFMLVKQYEEIKLFYNKFKDTFDGFSSLSLDVIKTEFSFSDYLNILSTFLATLSSNNFQFNDIVTNDDITKNFKRKIDVITSTSKKVNFGYNKLQQDTSDIYYSIDNTDIIVKYNFQTEKFTNIKLHSKNITILPFSRSTNLNSVLYITGGIEKSNEPSCECFSFEELNGKNKISNIQRMNRPRSGHCIMAISPSTIFVFGGINKNNSCEMYNTVSKRWEEIASLNEERIDGIPFVSKSKIFIFGGLELNKTTRSYVFKNTIEYISMQNIKLKEKWTQIHYESEDQNVLGRSLSGVVYSEKGKVLIIGGQTDKSTYSDDILIFTESEDNINIMFSDTKLPKKTAFIDSNFSSLYRNFMGFDLYGDLFLYNIGTDAFHFILNTNYNKNEEEDY